MPSSGGLTTLANTPVGGLTFDEGTLHLNRVRRLTVAQARDDKPSLAQIPDDQALFELPCVTMIKRAGLARLKRGPERCLVIRNVMSSDIAPFFGSCEETC